MTMMLDVGVVVKSDGFVIYIPRDWAKGGDGTNRLFSGQTLRYGQSLYSDPTKKFAFTIDLQGQLVIKRATTPAQTVWYNGTDTAVGKTAYLQLTQRGQLVIRGTMNPSEGGPQGEITLWTGGVYLKFEGRDLSFVVEEDDAPGFIIIWEGCCVEAAGLDEGVLILVFL
jgi:hypothetical protein